MSIFIQNKQEEVNLDIVVEEDMVLSKRKLQLEFSYNKYIYFSSKDKNGEPRVLRIKFSEDEDCKISLDKRERPSSSLLTGTGKIQISIYSS